MQYVAVRNRSVEAVLRNCVKRVKDVFAESGPAHDVIGNSHDDTQDCIYDFCGLRYDISCSIQVIATITVLIELPAVLELSLDEVLPHVNVVFEQHDSVQVRAAGSTTVQAIWSINADPAEECQQEAIVCLLAHVRFHILSATLRSYFQHGSAAEQLAPKLHALHPRLCVVTVRTEQGVLVIVPLAGRDAAYDTFLHNLVKGFTQQPKGPQCSFWDPKAAPAEVRGFPRVLSQGTAGFLTFMVLFQDAIGPALEGVLHSLVFFQDFVDSATLSCKLLTRARMRAKFAQYQQTFDHGRTQPQQL